MSEKGSSQPNQKARWYLAELVLKITVEDDDRNIVHKNLTLVEAESAEDAYNRAMALGRENSLSYKNPVGKTVDIKFEGLGELSFIHDQLEHGAELYYEECLNMSAKALKELLLPKDDLTVFREIEPSKGPDYSSAEILDEASRLLNSSRKEL